MINIIVAISKNGVIGNNSKIPWDIKEDKEYFSKITQNSVLIMGRNTFQEIGKALFNRYIIVLSKTQIFEDNNVCTCTCIKNAVNLSKKLTEKGHYTQTFICGGSQVYKEALKFADRLYVSKIDAEYQGNIFFPNVDFEKLKRLNSKRINTQTGIKLTFEEYEL